MRVHILRLPATEQTNFPHFQSFPLKRANRELREFADRHIAAKRRFTFETTLRSYLVLTESWCRLSGGLTTLLGWDCGECIE
jgi:hypothetical protein